MIKSILFFGDYPNPIDVTHTIFYQKLIYEIADLGIECTVISPVSIAKYRTKISKIPIERYELTRKGNRIRVISPRCMSFSSKRIGPIDTHVFTIRTYRKCAIKQVKKYNLKFDATYGHFINVGGIPACKIGTEYGVPSFVANGESDLRPSTYNYSSPYDLSAFKNCSGVISVSEKNKNELISLSLIEPNKIRVFPNGVDHTIFNPRNKFESRKKYGFPQNATIACFVGSFSERKGDKRVLEASKNIDGLNLVFVGNGEPKPVGNNVLFCDRVNNLELPEILSACDFFVLPTLNEGCCNAILEALSCGLPVISSNLPFNDNVLTEANSIRINPNSITELHEALLKLSNDTQLRNSLSVGALQSSNQFNISERAKKIVDYMNCFCSSKE